MGIGSLRIWLSAALLSGMAACAPAVVQEAPARAPVATITPSPDFPRDARGTAQAFVQVLQRMQPAVERECVQRRRHPISCDFQFVVVDDPALEVNAFQDIDPQGRPIIGFTLAMIAEARNADELAFVIGHEASHHILQHMRLKSASAQKGAAIFGAMASASGANPVAIRNAARLGADVGARYYSKEWELEADYLGTIITLNAGYDPLNGARFFLRIPDPGDRILGSHPSRQQRLDVVGAAISDIRTGRVH